MKALLHKLARGTGWTLVVLAAWLLIVAFAWEYATNAYIIERLAECRHEATLHLRRARSEHDDLEAEAFAIEADPFYAERLLRHHLHWVRADETPADRLPAPEPAPPPGPAIASPLTDGPREALFVSPCRRPVSHDALVVADAPEPRL